MKKREGFIYTLEAIIASSLILGIAVTVVPEFDEEQDLKLQQLQTGLESLDKRGKLADNLSTGEVENEIDPYIASGLNYTVEIAEVKTTHGVISSPGEVYLSGEGNFAELQLFIRNPSNLDATYGSTTLFENQNSEEYKEVALDSTEGFFNLTGSGTVEYEFDVYSRETGGNVTGDDVESYNYPVYSNGSKEVQVKVWKE